MSISELSKLFNVTEETVRNDLAELQSDNTVKRVRGGAFLIEPSDNEVPFGIRSEMLKNEKKQIAKTCIQFIKSGDTIALDSSTTVNCLAKEIEQSDLSITVITNSIVNANILMNCKNINLVVLGGVLRSKSKSLIGQVTDESIKWYVVDKSFVSCSGLSMKFGPTDTNEQESRIRESFFQASETNYLLADNTKFDYRTAFLISHFDLIDYVVTNEEPAKKWRNYLEKNKVKLLV